MVNKRSLSGHQEFARATAEADTARCRRIAFASPKAIEQKAPRLNYNRLSRVLPATRLQRVL